MRWLTRWCHRMTCTLFGAHEWRELYWPDLTPAGRRCKWCGAERDDLRPPNP